MDAINKMENRKTRETQKKNVLFDESWWGILPSTDKRAEFGVKRDAVMAVNHLANDEHERKLLYDLVQK